MKPIRGGLLLGVAVVLACAVPSGGTPAAKSDPGDLDPSFGSHGRVTTRCLVHCHANAVVIDSQRRIVAAGEGTNARFGVVRYRASGDLDRSFGSKGRVTTRFPGPLPVSVATSAATDPQGRLVVGGSNCDVFENSGDPDFPCRFALARYRADGSLDGSFNGNGRVVSSFGTYASLSSVAIDSKGRILAAGTQCEGTCSFLVARYRANGHLDSSFGDGGSRTIKFGVQNEAKSMAIDHEGRIVVVGRTGIGGPSQFAVARYLPSGNLDHSFGAGGKVTTGFGSEDAGARSVAIDARGRIIAAGFGDHTFALVRYRSNGDPDPSFGGDGKLATRFGRRTSIVYAVAIDSSSRIVATGQAGADFDLALARYRPNGVLDRSFGKRGRVTTSFGHGNSGPNAAAIDSRDRIVAAGGHTNFVLARFIGYSGHH